MEVGGGVARGFERVRKVFEEVVGGQPGTGAAFAAWHDGRWVVDLWGGHADADRSRAWTPDTLVMPYSVTKPFAAVCVLLLVDRGAVGLDVPASTYWPELAAPATVREVLAHQSGLVLLDEDLPTEAFWDWDRVCAALARQEPLWAPGTAHGESALFYGHLTGELVRRVAGATPGRFLREAVCGPLGLDFHVGLRPPELARVADLTGFDEDFRADARARGPVLERALGNPPGARDPQVVNTQRWRAAEIPAVNGHGTARAVAGLYVALEQGRLLSRELHLEASRPVTEGMDRVLGHHNAWGLGFGVDEDGYGMGGLGGSYGGWSRTGGYAVAFVTGYIAGHERAERLENELRSCLGLGPL